MRAPYQLRNVLVREEGAGPLVVLIHGYPLDGDMWEDVSRRLASRFRVLRPDLPSRRDTPHPMQPTMAEYARWIAAVIEASGGKAGVAGFSMGGYVLFELLRQKPQAVSAAAFIDTQAGPDTPEAREARNRSLATAREMGPTAVSEAMIPRLLSKKGRSDPALVGRVRAMVRRQNPNSLENDILAMRDRADSTPSLPSIAVASLAVVGSEDTITPPEKAESIARAIPAAKLVRIEGAGHLSPMERPEGVASALGELFSQPAG
jgi:pimeloyl-ACP methyl ester carboxylesterase